MIETKTKSKVGEMGWQRGDRMIKGLPKREMKEAGGKGVDWLVKFIAKREVSKGGWKRINRLVKGKPKREVKNGWGKVVDWLVKFMAK